MYNKVILIGRTTKDVELRRTNTGTAVTTFTLAVNERYCKEGEEPKTNFISCVAWRVTAEFMEKYVPKGSLVLVEGRLQTRNYDDTDGKKVYVTEVVVDNLQALETKKEREEHKAETQEETKTLSPEELNKIIDEDELPF